MIIIFLIIKLKMGCDKLPSIYYTNDPNDALGAEKTLAGTCVGSLFPDSLANQFIPQNGEYSIVRMVPRGCNTCGLSPPNEITCGLGCDGISCCANIGNRPIFARTSYKANPTDCCSQEATTIGDLTCDPNYRTIDSPLCTPLMVKKCTDPARMFTDSSCIKWCSYKPEECRKIKAGYCNQFNNLKLNSNCQKFCIDNPGLCDNSASGYCDVYPDTSFCSCLNSPLNKYKYNPLCQDGNCIRQGYQPTNLLTGIKNSGCDIIDCSVYFNLENIQSVNITDPTITQRCGNSAISRNEVNGVPITDSKLVSTGNIENDTQDNDATIATIAPEVNNNNTIIGVAIILIILGILWYIIN